MKKLSLKEVHDSFEQGSSSERVGPGGIPGCNDFNSFTKTRSKEVGNGYNHYYLE